MSVNHIVGDGYEINFNPDTTQGVFGDEDGGPETCLIMLDMPCGKDGRLWKGRQSFILKGNWMPDYRALVDVGASKWSLHSFYREHRAQHGSRWSYDFHEWGKDGVVREDANAAERAK